MLRRAWSSPVGDPVGNDPGSPAARAGVAALEQQVDHVVLVEELDARLDALLVERLQDHVAGPVGGEARAADRTLAEVPGVAAEAALVDLALGRPVERQAHVLELDDRLDRLAGEDLGGILVGQVVPALDRVEHVPFPVVFLEVAEGGADPALGGPGVRPGGIELAQDRRRHAGLGELQGRPQAGPARSHDQRIEVLVHAGLRRSAGAASPPRSCRTRTGPARAGRTRPSGRSGSGPSCSPRPRSGSRARRG